MANLHPNLLTEHNQCRTQEKHARAKENTQLNHYEPGQGQALSPFSHTLFGFEEASETPTSGKSNWCTDAISISNALNKSNST